MVATAMASAACVATEPPPGGAARLAAKVTAPGEARPSVYASLLRRSDIGTAIPTTGKIILVNIPSYELVALQDGEPVLRSRVVVGKPATPTSELLASLVAVGFDPDWTPTPSMIRNERLRYMPPGPQNLMGRVMFDLDNGELIYLHDTNERRLFDRRQRAPEPRLHTGAAGAGAGCLVARRFAGNCGLHDRARVDLFRPRAGAHRGCRRLLHAVSRRTRRDRLLSRHLCRSADRRSEVAPHPWIASPFSIACHSSRFRMIAYALHDGQPPWMDRGFVDQVPHRAWRLPASRPAALEGLRKWSLPNVV